MAYSSQGKSCSFLSRTEDHSFSMGFPSTALEIYILRRQSSTAKELLTSTFYSLVLSAKPGEKTGALSGRDIGFSL